LKVLSIVRFKPKLNHLEDVIKELRSHNQRCRTQFNQQCFLSEVDGEIYLVKISPSIEKISEDQEVSLAHYRSHTASAVEGEARSALMAVGVKGLITQPAH